MFLKVNILDAWGFTAFTMKIFIISNITDSPVGFLNYTEHNLIFS